MQSPPPRAEYLLDLAENYMRTVGYDAFSFRDLATDAGIKSASVHYHFPTKEQLAAAVTKRYAQRFFAALGPATNDAATPAAQMDAFIEQFRRALHDDGRMCLFCILGAQYSALPAQVQDQVRSFISDSTAWLAIVLQRFAAQPALASIDADARARAILATLEGAMIVARASQDLVVYDRIVDQLRVCGLIPTSAS